MRRLARGLLYAIVAYPVAAFAGYFLVIAFSSNGFDRSVEAAMTSVFAIGPAGAMLGFVIGVVRGARRSR